MVCYRCFFSPLRGSLVFVFLVMIIINTTAVAAPVQWQATTENKQLRVQISPEKGHYKIGEYHAWHITIKDQQAKPIDDASITIAGGMKSHGHGLPSQPIVTRYLGEGTYLIEGVLFNMSGQWTLLFGIQTKTYRDKVTFDIELSF